MSRQGRVDDREAVVLDAGLATQFAELGVEIPADQVAAAPPQADVFEVLPANWPAVTAFLACETQWRIAATMGGLIWLGLDYAAVDVVLRRSGASPDFADLQLMEAAALEVFSEDRP